MAILWEETRDGVRYEVRSAGASRRLYTDGVFHSSFNPQQPVTGGVWDLLTLSAFLVPEEKLRRVLLLGVGGGTVIRQLHGLFPDVHVTGVDLNAAHLDIARRFFEVGDRNVDLHCADAVRWLERNRERYDLVIDDLFGGAGGEPDRAVKLTTRWCQRLMRHLEPHGVLAVNCVSPAELSRAALVTESEFQAALPTRFRLRTARDENAVGLFARSVIEPDELRHRLLAVPGWNPNHRSTRLKYTLRRLG